MLRSCVAELAPGRLLELDSSERPQALQGLEGYEGGRHMPASELAAALACAGNDGSQVCGVCVCVCAR